MALLDELLGLGQPGATNPIEGLGAILGDIFGSGPSLRASSRPGDQPAPLRLAPPAAQQPVPSMISSDPSIIDRLSAMQRGYKGGGIVGGLIGAIQGADREQQLAAGTFNSLVNRGVDPAMAKLIVSDRDTLRKVVPAIFSSSISPKRPEIFTIKTVDEFGNPVERSMIWDARNRRAIDASQLLGRQSQQPDTQQQPAVPQAQVPAVQTVPSPFQQNAPAPAPSTVRPALGTVEPTGEPGTGVTQPKAPVAQPAEKPAQASVSQPQGRYFFGPPAAANRIPKGYIQKMDQGRFLYQRVNGRPQPVVEPKEAANSETKLAQSKIDDNYKINDAISGIDRSFKLANELIYHPGTLQMAARPFGGEVGVFGSSITSADVYPGTSMADAFNKHKVLVSNVALRTMERLKSQSTQGATGFGALSEKELRVLQDSIANLRLSSSHGELIKNYKDFQGVLLDTRNRLIDRYKNKYGEYPKGVETAQDLINSTTEDALSSNPQLVRPRQFLGTAIPFTSTTEPY